MKRFHPMPFGAQVRDDGQVRFRLWAPAQADLNLVLQQPDTEQVLPMARGHDGWFELVTGQAIPGSHYGFQLGDGLRVPDPASRLQLEDVHGLSVVVDPRDYRWQDGAWTGRPWEEAVLYELHIGAFTPEGTFRAVIDRLDHLVALGVTAVEIMPVADFPGRHNWGYDGVLPFAPDTRYGQPQDLKALVEAAHARKLMVLLDVVYNHFGPEGNYLHCYAPQFFTERHKTPWGAAINFDDADSRNVRDFFIHNALYWLEEYHVDGLRLDAVHAIMDDSRPDILRELAQTVAAGPGRDRRIHLILENDRNQARYLARDRHGQPTDYVAQWNDDLHHALHVLVTGEADGYYEDYSNQPLWHLGRCLSEGFSYQGEPSRHRHGEPRGEPSGHLPPTAFVNFLQTHDQVGNRAFGDRLSVLAAPEARRAASAILLLSPQTPFLFMGEEWGCRAPFPFFCDFGPDLAAAVTEGRRREFARFPAFSDPASRARIPDPNDPATFAAAVLDWHEPDRPENREWLEFHRDLLALRRRELVPRLSGLAGGQSGFRVLGSHGLAVHWRFRDGSRLHLLANLGEQPLPGVGMPAGTLLYATTALSGNSLPAWTAAWFLESPS